MSDDPSSRHHGSKTYRLPVPGRDGTAAFYSPRLRGAAPPRVPGATHAVPAAQERLDTLAWREVGDAFAFHRLADINGVYDPLSLVEPGRRIMLPRKPR